MGPMLVAGWGWVWVASAAEAGGLGVVIPEQKGYALSCCASGETAGVLLRGLEAAQI